MQLVAATKKTKAQWLAQAVRLEKKSFSKSDSLGQRLVEEAMKPHNTLVLAVADGAVHGYILFRRNGTEGHIDRIVVAEPQRRRGVGRSLLQFAVATLRTNRAAVLLLEADTANAGAIALYDSQGFARTAVRADYYKPGRDALLMELKL
ncbi:Ribosomal-protein-alanine acetyltransferase [Phytophthora cinnamomi]|uniref:Ribosomal-protein-alanine acetyltransferase n=1 Tax=Phytophthora cinnamomi TaxID=4785 RepID=UPI00355A9BE9|nr:Ribosomal-protein-alanine acetyltransferase [Phytophthora cinnamomi]